VYVLSALCLDSVLYGFHKSALNATLVGAAGAIVALPLYFIPAAVFKGIASRHRTQRSSGRRRKNAAARYAARLEPVAGKDDAALDTTPNSPSPTAKLSGTSAPGSLLAAPDTPSHRLRPPGGRLPPLPMAGKAAKGPVRTPLGVSVLSRPVVARETPELGRTAMTMMTTHRALQFWRGRAARSSGRVIPQGAQGAKNRWAPFRPADENVPHARAWQGLALALAMAAAAVYMTVRYVVKFEDPQALGWCIASATSLGFFAFVLEPLRCILLEFFSDLQAKLNPKAEKEKARQVRRAEAAAMASALAAKPREETTTTTYTAPSLPPLPTGPDKPPKETGPTPPSAPKFAHHPTFMAATPLPAVDRSQGISIPGVPPLTNTTPFSRPPPAETTAPQPLGGAGGALPAPPRAPRVLPPSWDTAVTTQPEPVVMQMLATAPPHDAEDAVGDIVAEALAEEEAADDDFGAVFAELAQELEEEEMAGLAFQEEDDDDLGATGDDYKEFLSSLLADSFANDAGIDFTVWDKDSHMWK